MIDADASHMLCAHRYLKPDENKKSKHKTAVKKKTLNPEFNEVQSLSHSYLPQPTAFHYVAYKALINLFTTLTVTHRALTLLVSWPVNPGIKFYTFAAHKGKEDRGIQFLFLNIFLNH